MSSLAAVQADGYYYPPDWTPDGGSASLRARVGTKGAKGALGKKNAKLKPRQPTVRFEMPFDVGCSQCDATIGKGVRFNAAKTAVGTYHSTTVWAFEMKTAGCPTPQATEAPTPTRPPPLHAHPAAAPLPTERAGQRCCSRL